MAIRPLDWHLDDFAGGIDLRPGAFSRAQNAFRVLDNYCLTIGRHLRRRWPWEAGGLTVPAQSQGIIPFAGGLATLVRREVSGGTYGMRALPFDTPDGCTTAWSLVDWAIFEDHVLALIRHTLPGTMFPSIVRLHVIGAVREPGLPTYVEDPYCPSNWKGGITVRPGMGYYDAAWEPRIVVAQGKAYVSDPNGDVAFCKTGNVRAWNTKTITQLVEEGQEYAFVIPDDGSHLKTWTTPELYADFQLDTLTDSYRFTAYVLEWYDETTSAWNAIPEVRTSPSTDKTWRLIAVSNRYGAFDDLARVELCWTGGQAVVRLRLVLAERSEVLAGDVVSISTTNVSVASGTHQITKDGVDTEYDTDALTSTAVTTADAWILLDDTGVKTAFATTSKSAVTIVTATPTGYQRWRHHVLAYLHLATGTLTDAPMQIDDAWQAVRKIALAEFAGDGDAGILRTSAHTGTGADAITAMGLLRQRLIVWYARSSQLWLLGELAADHQLIDTGAVGTGTQVSPEPAPLENSLVIATPLGLRQFSIQSLADAYVNEDGIGDQVRAIGPIDQKAATYWPWTGQYVTAVTLGSETFILAYDFAPASKVAGWSRWTMVGFAAPGRKGLVAVDDKLYVRVGDVVRCWNASATVFRDVTDPVGQPAYRSTAVWPFNDFKSPGKVFAARHIDVVQSGRADFSLRYNPRDERWESPSVSIDGRTPGLGKVPFIASGPALALVLTSTDETGHELESVAIEITTRSR